MGKVLGARVRVPMGVLCTSIRVPMGGYLAPGLGSCV